MSELKPNTLICQDAERALAGCLLLTCGTGGLESYDAAMDAGITDECFTDAISRSVWQAASSLAVSSEYFDSLTIKASARLTNEDYDKLIDGVPTAVHAPEYANRVREAYRKRQLRAMAREIEALTEDAELTAGDIQARLEADLFKDESTISRDRETRAGALALAQADFYERALRGEAGISTGHEWLDDAFGGMIAGRLYVISGQPGCGKSTLCRNIAHHVAVAGHRADILTLEIPAREVAADISCHLSGTWMVSLDAGRSAADVAKYRNAAVSMTDLPLHIQGGLFTPSKMFSWARRAVSKGSRLIMVDYIQRLAADDPKASDERRVALASSMALDIALKFNVPVLAVSSESNQGNLRHSGQITYDAAGWVRLTMLEDKTTIQATLEKHRHGKGAGAQNLVYDNGRLVDPQGRRAI